MICCGLDDRSAQLEELSSLEEEGLRRTSKWPLQVSSQHRIASHEAVQRYFSRRLTLDNVQRAPVLALGVLVDVHGRLALDVD